MKRLRKILAISLVLTILCLPMMAFGQTSNIPATTPGVVFIPLHISGQYTTSTTAVARFVMPQRVRALSVMAAARVSGGTTPTLTVDVLSGGTSILTAPISVNTTTATFGTFTAAGRTIADEAVITVNLALGGTSPTWNDITVMLVVQRL